MKFTENEAKDKLCPARCGDFCVGSNCMAWEWVLWETKEGHVFKQDTDTHITKPYKGKCGMVKYEG